MKEEIRRSIRDDKKILGIAAGIIFATVAFVVTSCFLLFFHNSQLTALQVRSSAILVFLNVILITFLFVVIYAGTRYFTVIRPLRRIDQVLEKVSSGDFSEKIDETSIIGNFRPVARKLNRMIGELESSAVMKTDFVSNISHELKTPLAAMQNYGSLLKSPGLPENERIEYAEGVVNASRRMSELITNILRLNRLENHQLYAKREQFNLAEQLGECVLGYENVWEEKNIDLQIDMDEDVTICSDPELLSLIWNNLLSNAFKFTEPGGIVSVSLSANEKTASVRVADTGCGIDAETGKHIFEKFYQGDTSHATQGNGLGLALVSRVINIVEGEISVDSEPGKGTSFTVTIPRNIEGQEEEHGK